MNDLKECIKQFAKSGGGKLELTTTSRDGVMETYSFDIQDLSDVDSFEWVKEYCDLFYRVNPKAPTFYREALLRMRILFNEVGDLSSDKVLQATRMYLSNTDPTYLMRPHYFIFKGVGVEKTYTLLSWVEKLDRVSDRQVRGSRVML